MQIGVSVHAVGAKGTVPLGWALYLPAEWCEDQARRAKAKIPEEIAFKTKPELGVELVERAADWGLPAAGSSGFYLSSATFRSLADSELSVDESINAGRLVVQGAAPRMHELISVLKQVVSRGNGNHRATHVVN